MSFLSKIFRRHDPAPGIFDGFTDCHSHLLPGVDDGVKTLDESLALLAELERRGWHTLWLTPHIMEDIPNTTAALRERFDELRHAYSGPINLHLASENMLDELYAERLAGRDLLPFADGHILVETSFYDGPINLLDLLEATIEAGFKPILAHPERYIYMRPDLYREIKDLNVEFQLNLMSTVGHYGPQAQEKARWLFGQGYYDRCGSDIHHAGHLRAIDAIPRDTNARQLAAPFLPSNTDLSYSSPSQTNQKSELPSPSTDL